MKSRIYLNQNLGKPINKIKDLTFCLYRTYYYFVDTKLIYKVLTKILVASIISWCHFFYLLVYEFIFFFLTRDIFYRGHCEIHTKFISRRLKEIHREMCIMIMIITKQTIYIIIIHYFGEQA